MTMHLVRGMTTINTKKRKNKNKSKKLLIAEAEHKAFLERVGYKGLKQDYRYAIPDYKTGPRMTSDNIAGNGSKKESNTYTGTEIMGYVVTHKSNLMPIRKDNKQAAIDAASMRRN